MSERASRRMTIAEFLVWQSDQQDRYELVNGQPKALTGTRLRHDRLTVNAISEIQRQLRAKGNPCDAFSDDIAIQTTAGNLRRPDVSVLCPPFDEDAMISDSPRLVVEVLSESTEQIDRFVKLDEYKAIETLDYIVIAEPTRIEVGFWFRDPARGWRNGTYHQLAAVIEMPNLGITVGLASLYERVTLTPRARPRLVWEEAGEAVTPSGTRPA